MPQATARKGKGAASTKATKTNAASTPRAGSKLAAVPGKSTKGHERPLQPNAAPAKKEVGRMPDIPDTYRASAEKDPLIRRVLLLMDNMILRGVPAAKASFNACQVFSRSEITETHTLPALGQSKEEAK